MRRPFVKGTFPISGGEMEFLSFGRGFPLLIIPGLGDGLTTVGKSALQLYLYYRSFRKKSRVIVASRPEPVPPGATTRSMAGEYAALMNHLGFSTYNILGISMGGMIGQFLAADFPENIEKAVLAVTVPELDDKGKNIVNNWIELARNDDFKKILIDTTLNTFQEPKASRYVRLLSIFGGLMRPKSLSRFILQGEACLKHNGREVLQGIKTPTLVISGENDQITAAELGKELSVRISGSTFKLLEGVGHGGFEEKKEEFCKMLWDFLYQDKQMEV